MNVGSLSHTHFFLFIHNKRFSAPQYTSTSLQLLFLEFTNWLNERWIKIDQTLNKNWAITDQKLSLETLFCAKHESFFHELQLFADIYIQNHGLNFKKTDGSEVLMYVRSYHYPCTSFFFLTLVAIEPMPTPLQGLLSRKNWTFWQIEDILWQLAKSGRPRNPRHWQQPVFITQDAFRIDLKLI